MAGGSAKRAGALGRFSCHAAVTFLSLDRKEPTVRENELERCKGWIDAEVTFRPQGGSYAQEREARRVMIEDNGEFLYCNNFEPHEHAYRDDYPARNPRPI